MDKLLDGTPHGVHSHVCGYEPRVDAEAYGLRGCGWEWEHDGVVTGAAFGKDKTKPSVTYKELHTCPNCGEGPWYAIKPGTHPQSQRERRELLDQPASLVATLLAAMVLASQHPGLIEDFLRDRSTD